MRAVVEDDLRSLRLERIGLVNLRLGVGGIDPDPVPLAEQLGALTDLREEGKLDLIGISTVSAELVQAALEITPIAEVQNAFSIANRVDQPVLDLCCRHGIAYVLYYPSAPRSPVARRRSPPIRRSHRWQRSTASRRRRSRSPGCSTATTACC